MATQISKGNLIGDVIFLTLGTLAAAQLSLQFPAYIWLIVLSFVGLRVGIELAVASRKKLRAKSIGTEEQTPRQVAHV
jgi:hypothetical protein